MDNIFKTGKHSAIKRFFSELKPYKQLKYKYIGSEFCDIFRAHRKASGYPRRRFDNTKAEIDAIVKMANGSWDESYCPPLSRSGKYGYYRD